MVVILPRFRKTFPGSLLRLRQTMTLGSEDPLVSDPTGALKDGDSLRPSRQPELRDSGSSAKAAASNAAAPPPPFPSFSELHVSPGTRHDKDVGRKPQGPLGTNRQCRGRSRIPLFLLWPTQARQQLPTAAGRSTTPAAVRAHSPATPLPAAGSKEDSIRSN